MSAFGTVFMPEMAISWFDGSSWSASKVVPSDSLTLHPGAHVLHYSSTCFEGQKAFRHADGSVHIFRIDRNIERMAKSSRLLGLPEIDQEQLSRMITDLVAHFAKDVPAAPGSMYIRPTHIGTEAAVGKAGHSSASSCLYVLLCPVGDYFEGGDRALRLFVEDKNMRCPPHMGQVKSGGNYAAALYPTHIAEEKYKCDQVLFAPGGDVEETGASNFLLIDGNEIITKNLDASFLHGVTRESILTLARDMGMKVSERAFTVDELLERCAHADCEAALSGTAAVLAPVGSLIHDDKEYKIGNGGIGEKTLKLRKALNDIQWGLAEDKYGWMTRV